MLLLDEPTSGLGHEDIGRIAELIRNAARDRTVLMVEHNLSVVADLSQTDHGPDPRPGAGRGRLRHGLEQSRGRRGVYGDGDRPCLRRSRPSELLRVEELHAWYGELHILHGMDFSVGEGEVVTLLGRNGAGKTTTLRAIMGIVGQRTGSVRYRGTELVGLPSNRIARLGVAYCPRSAASSPASTSRRT